ncbi:MAG: CsgG/HfaB family protein [Candidatus Scalindua sp.]|nr:CsgG/HfaB family protein [Candidatus Scalindua sp.]
MTTNSGPDFTVNRGFPQQEIQKIAVLMFETTWDEEDESKFSLSQVIAVPDAGSVLADITASELIKWGRYAVLDRRDLKKQLFSMKIREEEILMGSDYENLGRSLGVDAVVIGVIETFGVSYKKLFGKFASAIHSKVSFQAECIEVLTNETVWSFKVKGSSDDLHERAFASALVARAVENLKKEID